MKKTFVLSLLLAFLALISCGAESILIENYRDETAEAVLHIQQTGESFQGNYETTSAENAFTTLTYTEREIVLDLPPGTRPVGFADRFIYVSDSSRNETWIFNTSGELVVYICPFSTARVGGVGVLRVFLRDENDCHSHNALIYIDINGNPLNSEPFFYGTGFNNEGYAVVQLYELGPMYLMDRSGELVRRLTDGDFFFCERYGYGSPRSGFIHVMHIEPTKIFNGLVRVHDFILIDINDGEIIHLPAPYTQISQFRNGRAVVSGHGESGWVINIVDTNLNALLPNDVYSSQFSSINTGWHGGGRYVLIPTEDRGILAIFDLEEGVVIRTISYGSPRIHRNGLLDATVGDYRKLMDIYGNIIYSAPADTVSINSWVIFNHAFMRQMPGDNSTLNVDFLDFNGNRVSPVIECNIVHPVGTSLSVFTNIVDDDKLIIFFSRDGRFYIGEIE